MADELYIGLMSGTSMDGIDAVLVRIDDRSCTITAAVSPSYPKDVRVRLETLIANAEDADLAEIGALHTRIARAFGAAVGDLLNTAGVPAADITAIGSHGQTVFHNPTGSEPFSMQLGDPGTLAATTTMSVVADFRNTDIALGGQGAPLVSAFHRWAFGTDAEDRAVVNIGGIANITMLYAKGATTGFDTGPGNVLLDLWCNECQSRPYDDNGAWAATGTVDADLLSQMQADPYFSLPAPKSTGRDYFNSGWLHEQLDRHPLSPAPADVEATLSELTAQEIARAVQTTPACEQVAVCGGGARNSDLLARLRRALPTCSINTTAAWGIEPEWVEAAAFAWLARQRLHGLPTNVPDVTGASALVSLGGVYLPPSS